MKINFGLLPDEILFVTGIEPALNIKSVGKYKKVRVIKEYPNFISVKLCQQDGYVTSLHKLDIMCGMIKVVREHTKNYLQVSPTYYMNYKEGKR